MRVISDIASSYGFRSDHIQQRGTEVDQQHRVGDAVDMFGIASDQDQENSSNEAVEKQRCSVHWRSGVVGDQKQRQEYRTAAEQVKDR